MRRFVKNSKFNKGFSLIEVLVAMAVITLISIPLLRTFVTSAQINNKSKKLQNATEIAQNVSENFTTIPLLTLVQNNQNDREVCGEYLLDTSNDMIVFQNIGDGHKDENDIPYFEGNDGEKFYVTVTMNPDEYSKSSDIVGVQDINNYIVPSMGDLFSTDVVTAYSQFTKYDNRVCTAFRNQYPDEAAFTSPDFTTDDIKKDAYIYIEQYQNGTHIDYEYRLRLVYTYCTSHTTDYQMSTYYVDYTFTLAEGTLSSYEKMPELFILYTPFDRDPSCVYTFARDEIHIEYMMNSTVTPYTTPEWEKETKVFIIEQAVTKGLNKNYIWLAHHGGFSATALSNYGAGSSCPKLEIYSTINGWPMNVTAGQDMLLELYEMDVYVWHNKPDPNDITSYGTGNADLDDVFTSVEAIKEEKP